MKIYRKIKRNKAWKIWNRKKRLKIKRKRKREILLIRRIRMLKKESLNI